MKPLKSILRRSDTLFGENLFISRRILINNYTQATTWKGAKRYAH
ncbi:hypothetical protein [Gaetbulibacter aestuarii]|uniref:Uncharacterized protein n=1 Tax=Gaetbulibacter aestuarii TaxID=1502358 RepID=A0ABW7N3C1_9FLAO